MITIIVLCVQIFQIFTVLDFVSEMKTTSETELGKHGKTKLGKPGTLFKQKEETELGEHSSSNETNKTDKSAKLNESKESKIEGDIKDKQVLSNEKTAYVCNKCKRNINECGCERKAIISDLKITPVSQDETGKSEEKSKGDNHISNEGQSVSGTKSERGNVKGSTEEHSEDKNVKETNSNSEPNEGPSDKSSPPDGPQSDQSSANKSSENVTLSSIKKLVSQVSEKIAAETLSSSQKAKSSSNGAGHLNSCVRQNLQPCQGDFVNHSDCISEKRMLLNSHENGLDNIRDSGNLHQLLLSNMLKLTSPPNQQVFPNSLPAIPVQGMVRAYQHGALPNARPVFNQLPVHNIPRFGIPNSDIGQAIGNGLCNYGSPRFPNITHYPWMNRKSKSKKTKSEKEKQIQNMFESESPPPNVDVSKLKDKGHGHIPKQKIASFMENPAEFMEQQTALVNSSISATSPIPNEPDEVESEPCEPIKRSESVDSDRLSGDERPDFVNSDRVSSPDKSINDKDRNVSADVSADMSEKDGNASSAMTGKEVNVPAMIENIKEEGNTLADTSEHKVAASVPHTPTAIVHHPPDVSQTSTSTSTSPDEKGKSDSDVKQGNQLSLAAILCQQNANPAFQQMFPNVVQEAFLHNIGFSNPQLLQGAIQTSLSQGQVSEAAPISKPAIANTHTDSTRQLGNQRNYMGRQMQQTSIRQILENQNTNEFPASNLLSAAARAQLLQQQNQMSIMLAQQMNGQINNPFFGPQINASVQGLHNHLSNGNTLANHLCTPDIPAAVGKPENGESTPNKAQINLKVHTSSSSTPKISELLSQSNSIVKKSNEVNSCVEKSNTAEKKNTLQNTGIIPSGQQLNVHENTVQQNINSVGVNQQLLNQQQLMQMCHAFGLPFMQTGPLDVIGNHLDSNGLQMQIPVTNTLQLQNQPSVVSERLTSNQTVGCPVQPSHPFIQPSAVIANNVSGNITVSPDKGSGNSTVQGNSAQFQGPVVQNRNILFTNNLQELNMLGAGINTNGNPPVIQGFSQMQPDLNVNVNRHGQQSGTTSEPSLIVMQNGIPMIQMVAPNQISVSSNVDSCNLPQLTLSNQGVGIQNLVQTGNQCSVSACRPVVPLNLINVQQSWNSGNTNLTAMQLQTLQLQQQLLQQIQQVQGMQNLINHFNIQGLSNNITNSPATSAVQVPLSTAMSITTSTLVNSSTSALPSNTTRQSPDRRQASLAVSEANSDVSSCVITSTVKSSRPDSVSTTCSLSESQENVTSTSVAITAADTTQESPVQCKTVTTRTVDIGTETEAFDEDTDDYDDVNEDDDDDDDDIDDDDENNDDGSHEDTESYDEDTEVSEKDDTMDDSETESEHEHEQLPEKESTTKAEQVANVLSPSKSSSPKSCYSLAIESVTAQRNKREAESMRSSRKRYYSSAGDFTTVKSESPDKRLKLVIRKRTGLSPIKDDDTPRKRSVQFEKETVDKSDRSEQCDKTEKIQSPSDIQKGVRLKIHKKKSLCETITSLYSSKDTKRIDKKHTDKPSVIKKKSDSNVSKFRSEAVENKLKGCESFHNKRTSCDEKASSTCTVKSGADDVKGKLLDCDSSSLEDDIEPRSRSLVTTVTSLDKSEPTTTTNSEAEYSFEKDKKQDELTSKIAAALTSQKGRWHLLDSPKKLKPKSVETAMTETPLRDDKGLKRARHLQDFEVVEGKTSICNL